MENEFENKRYTTLVKTREVTNCITSEKRKYPNEYFVYDNSTQCELVMPNFHPTCYEDIRNKAIELNQNENHGRDKAKIS